MQNNASTKIQIPLSGPLNLSANKIQTTDYTGYNNNNGQIYKNTLHPYYKGTHQGQYYKDADGNEYLLDASGRFYINGVINKTFSTDYTVELQKVDKLLNECLFYNETPDGLHTAYIIKSQESDIIYECYVDNTLVNIWSTYSEGDDVVDYNLRAVITNTVDAQGNVYFLFAHTQNIAISTSSNNGIHYSIYDVTNKHATQWANSLSSVSYYSTTNIVPITANMYYKDNHIVFAVCPMFCTTTKSATTYIYKISDYSVRAASTTTVNTYEGTYIGAADSQGRIGVYFANKVGNAAYDGLQLGTITAVSDSQITIDSTSFLSFANYPGFSSRTDSVYFNRATLSADMYYHGSASSFPGSEYSTIDEHYGSIYLMGIQSAPYAINYDTFLSGWARCPNSFSVTNHSNYTTAIYYNLKRGYINSWAINGTLLTNYDTFDTDWDVQQGCVKSSISNDIYRIKRNVPVSFYIDDGMIVFNICGPQNSYNTFTKRWEAYAYDYNEHYVVGSCVATSNGIVLPTQGYVASYANGLQSLTTNKCSSAINNPSSSYYSILFTNPNNVSVTNNALPMRRIDATYQNIYSATDQAIQVYYGTALTQVEYKGQVYDLSYKQYNSGGSFIIRSVQNSVFAGTTAYVDTNNASIYPLSISSTILSSYTNKDLSTDLSRSYALYYYNGLKHYAYQSDKIYENIQATFSIRGTQYAVVYDTIYELSSYTPIVSVQHMKFIGANTSTAYFYSYQDNAIYVFDGTITISYLMPQDGIGNVNNFAYNTGNGALILGCDNGLTIINSSSEQHFIPEALQTAHLYLSDSSIFAYNGTDTLVYSESDSTVGDVLPLDVSTCYYKSAGQKIVNTDCFYIKLYSGTPVDGTISCSQGFLLDKLSTTPAQTYNIKKQDWKDSPYISIRYQPKYNLNDGMALNITSDFPILSIEAGVTQTATNGVTRINI